MELVRVLNTGTKPCRKISSGGGNLPSDSLFPRRMPGETGGVTIMPELLLSLNPLIIIVFIPLFDRIFYPALEKYYLV